ncbi:hypothetical protein NMY22_g2098 [Coprinellus aureogranulatus]|nr:hypothetical protein NMY22_g2098 [Coprinellus aureogranulatus]
MEKKEGNRVKPPAPTSRVGLLATLFGEAPSPGKPDVPSEPDPEEKHEASKEAVLDRLARSRHVALERVGGALVALRALSDELEDMTQRVASPGPPTPIYEHLRHIYFEEKRLSETLNALKLFGKKASQTHCSCN